MYDWLVKSFVLIKSMKAQFTSRSIKPEKGSEILVNRDYMYM